MIPELQEKMIELGTQELMVAGADAITARGTAERDVKRAADLHARALVATGITVTYDKPRESDAFELNIDDIREANPGVDIQPAPGGGIYASAPSLTFPVTPPRPTQTAEELLQVATELKEADGDNAPCTKIHEGGDFDWCLSAHLSMLQNAMRYGHRKLYPAVPYPDVLASEAFDQYKPQPAPEDGCGMCGPDLGHNTEDDGLLVPPGDEDKITGRAMPHVPDRQELEDRLRVIAAIVEDQAPFGTELANFQRRLRFALQAGR